METPHAKEGVAVVATEAVLEATVLLLVIQARVAGAVALAGIQGTAATGEPDRSPLLELGSMALEEEAAAALARALLSALAVLRGVWDCLAKGLAV